MDTYPPKIKAKILFKLARHRKWGESHTAIEHATEGFKKSEIAEVQGALNELIKSGWVLVKPTGYGKQISLNPNVAPEIKRQIQNLLGIQL